MEFLVDIQNMSKSNLAVIHPKLMEICKDFEKETIIP